MLPRVNVRATAPSKIVNVGSARSPHVYRIFLYEGRPFDCYVGSTKGMANRVSVHLRHLESKTHSSSLLQAAWNKFGADAFGIEVLEMTSAEHLTNAEREWSFEFRTPNSLCPAYNHPDDVEQSIEHGAARMTMRPYGGKHWRLAVENSQSALSPRGKASSGAADRRSANAPNSYARLLAKIACQAQFEERARLAHAWCWQRDIPKCSNGAHLIFHIARCLASQLLCADDALPSIGALAKAVGLKPNTVSMALRRRPPRIKGLTITSSGKGLVVSKLSHGIENRQLDYYLLTPAERISVSLRENGVEPGQKCHKAKLRRFEVISPKI